MSAIDGSGRHVMATPGLQQEEAFDALAWSPDGSQLALTVFSEPGPTQIALLPIGATGVPVGRVLTDLPGWSARSSLGAGRQLARLRRA